MAMKTAEACNPGRRSRMRSPASLKPIARAATRNGRSCSFASTGRRSRRLCVRRGRSADGRPSQAPRLPPPASRCSRIIEDGAIDLEADVPEQELARLAVGMRAELKLPGVEDPWFRAACASSTRRPSRASRTGKVRISLEDVSHAHIGAFASGEVELRHAPGRPCSAPASALTLERAIQRGSTWSTTGRVEERQATPGIVNGEAVEIRQGLAEGRKHRSARRRSSRALATAMSGRRRKRPQRAVRGRSTDQRLQPHRSAAPFRQSWRSRS